jgi:hypothetical protein
MAGACLLTGELMMFAALRAYCLQQTLGMRETCRDLYRHYRLERARIEAQPRFSVKAQDDRFIMAAIARAKEEQRDQSVERQVRRLYEQSRFVSRPPKDAA